MRLQREKETDWLEGQMMQNVIHPQTRLSDFSLRFLCQSSVGSICEEDLGVKLLSSRTVNQPINQSDISSFLQQGEPATQTELAAVRRSASPV